MDRVFELRTEPHKATVGATTILLEPEVEGAAFAQAYAALQAAQKSAAPVKASSTKHAKDVDLDAVASLSGAMRKFIRTFVMEESRPDFDGLRLPDRVLVELLEWTSELYGGGSGNAEAADGDGGTSTA